jgi:Dolichyl-phosphate-mannose-protein mannosyltransferase
MPEHPPLAKLVAAVPLLFMSLDVPPPQDGDAQIGWSDALINVNNRDRPILGYSRSAIGLATVAMALVLWRLARRFYGATAAGFALALFVFHPTFLAHGHLSTTDLLSAFSFLLVSWAFWSWTRSPRLPPALAVGLSLGAAVCTRFTAWLLVPILILLLGLWLWARRADARRLVVPAAQLVLITAVSVFVFTWAVYGFHYAPWPGASCAQAVDPALGLPGQIVAALERGHVLPEAYLEGLRYQLEHNRSGHQAYFRGELGWTGWRSYYVVAFLIKNTFGFLAATVLVIVFVGRRARSFMATGPEWHFVVPAAVVFVVASLTRIQLGERYMLAVYPYLLLLAAAAVPWIVKWKHGMAVLGLCLLAHAVPSLLVARQGYLTYFNAIAGGPEGGHRWLADSNLDWGQDLPRLADWMKGHGVDAVQLGYFGADDADRYGIRHEDLPAWGASRPQSPATNPFHGTAAISANLMVGFLYPPDQDPYAFLRNRKPDDRAGVFFIYRFRQ